MFPTVKKNSVDSCGIFWGVNRLSEVHQTHKIISAVVWGEQEHRPPCKTSTLTLKVSNLLSLSPLSLRLLLQETTDGPLGLSGEPCYPKWILSCSKHTAVIQFPWGPWSYKARTNVGRVGVLGRGFLSDLHVYTISGFKTNFPLPKVGAQAKGLPVSARSCRCDTQRCSRGHTQHWMKAHEALTKWACRTW